jgi:hypothetical protein
MMGAVSTSESTARHPRRQSPSYSSVSVNNHVLVRLKVTADCKVLPELVTHRKCSAVT